MTESIVEMLLKSKQYMIEKRLVEPGAPIVALLASNKVKELLNEVGEGFVTCDDIGKLPKELSHKKNLIGLLDGDIYIYRDPLCSVATSGSEYDLCPGYLK